MKLGHYDKDAEIGYALGAFPSMELFHARPERVRLMMYSADGLRNEGIRKLLAACEERGLRAEEAPRALARLSGKENCHAALVYEKYEDDLCAASHRHLVLDRVSDKGNLGTILRAALGFGFTDVAVLRPAADVFDPKAVRASMGAVFHLRVRHFDEYAAYEAACPGRAHFFFRLEGAAPLGEAVRGKAAVPYTLAFGNEAGGLSPELLARETGVRIPHADTIDSLNLSVAAGIGRYTWRQEGDA